MFSPVVYITRNLGLIATVVLFTACGERTPPKTRVEGVGARGELGRLLTGNQWCTSPSEGKDPRFSKLDVRQNGQFIKTFYQINGDNSLARLGEERGTWAIVGRQLFTRTMREPRLRQKVVLKSAPTTDDAAATNSEAGGEPCFDLNDGAGKTTETYCTC